MNLRKLIAYKTFCCALFALLSICLFSCSLQDKYIKTVDNVVSDGFADLTNIELENAIVKLNGNWFFWKDELLSYDKVEERLKNTENSAFSQNETIKVPSYWATKKLFAKDTEFSSYGTLALIVTLPENKTDFAIRVPDSKAASRLIINGNYEVNIGQVSKNEENYIPRKSTEYLNFSITPGTDGKALIVWQVANFTVPKTGTWDSPTIGLNTVINNNSKASLIFETILVGSILFMGLYHLIMYLLRSQSTTPLYFSFICFFASIRTLMMNERIMSSLFPLTLNGYHFSYAVEHLSIHLCLPLFYMFIKSIYPKEVNKVVYNIVLILSGIWAILKLFTPLMFNNQILSYFEYFIGVAGVYIVFCLILAICRKRNGAIILSIGCLLLLVAAFNDILFSNGLIETFFATPIGIFLFTFAQSTYLARDNANNYTKIERFNVELKIINHSLERFIPKQVLKFLNKKSIVDVKLGDYTAQNMSVLFLDIRNFTSRSEKMSPKENFEFINIFLKEFGPIVRSNGGFIDKYLGDGFMALFPSSPDFALKSAIAMRNKLKKFNKLPEINSDVQFGIGIHYGPLMLGTIGESERMDSTVISDTVNSSSRLEQLNKVHGTDILISEQVIANLKHPEYYSFTKVGDEMVKGKSQPISVYTVKSVVKRND